MIRGLLDPRRSMSDDFTTDQAEREASGAQGNIEGEGFPRVEIQPEGLVVAAAGNEADARVAYPSRAKYAISVGATTEHLCQADYSNSGRGLDVVAPGGGNDSPNSDNPRDQQNCRPEVTGREIYQQTFTRNPRRFGLPNGYQGTSMAASHVSGIAALVIGSRRLGRNPSPNRVASHLRQTARDLGPDGYDSRYGHGLVDAAAALR